MKTMRVVRWLTGWLDQWMNEWMRVGMQCRWNGEEKESVSTTRLDSERSSRSRQT